MSSGEYYEYDVVTSINKDGGLIDTYKIIEILTLGVNALRVLGLGTNETVSEDVMIFERRIKEI